MLLVRSEDALELGNRNAFSPRGFDQVDLQADAACKVIPQVTELTEARGEDLVPGRHGIGESHLPACGACGGKQKAGSLGRFEYFFAVAKQGFDEFWKIWSPMVLLRDDHGILHGLRDVGRARGKQVISSRK